MRLQDIISISYFHFNCQDVISLFTKIPNLKKIFTLFHSVLASVCYCLFDFRHLSEDQTI